MQKTAGRFDLFDAWVGHDNPRRAQVARGQALFNEVNPGDAAATGAITPPTMAPTRTISSSSTSAPRLQRRARRTCLYTRSKDRTTGELRQLTDAGRGNVTGIWSDLGRFKTPTIRALAARAPYFHNGIAATLEDVIRHYEAHLGFIFTAQQRADLVAFLRAL